MRAIDGGTFLMGSDEFYADEGPVHEASVSPFLIDEAPVTTRQFAVFVAETGYLTTAERELPAADFPELDAGERRPGSLACDRLAGPVLKRSRRLAALSAGSGSLLVGRCAVRGEPLAGGPAGE